MQRGEVLQLSIREPNVSLLQHHRLLTGKINSRRSIYNKDLALTIMLLAVVNGALTMHYICPELMDTSTATLSKRYPHNLLCNCKFYITFLYIVQGSYPFLDMVKLNYPLSKQTVIYKFFNRVFKTVNEWPVLRSSVHILIELSLKGTY